MGVQVVENSCYIILVETAKNGHLWFEISCVMVRIEHLKLKISCWKWVIWVLVV